MMKKKVRNNDTSDSNKQRTLRNLVACLYYLAEEAEREGLKPVAGLFRDNIGNINAWSNGLPVEPKNALIDDSLYQAMAFLHKLVVCPETERMDFIKAFIALSKSYDNMNVRKICA